MKGTGLKDRITHDDVKAWVKQVLTGGASPVVPSLPQVPVVDFAKFGPVEVKPLGRIQKISGQRLQAAWINLPHVTQFDEADITELEAERAKLKDKAAAAGVKLTPLAFIIRACVLALREYPTFNASLRSGRRIRGDEEVHAHRLCGRHAQWPAGAGDPATPTSWTCTASRARWRICPTARARAR